MFYHLEHLGLLDAAHLHALHYVYIPRINRALEAFQEGWNHHSILTEGNHSPHQFFCTWIPNSTGLVTLDFTEQINSSYGIDEEGLISEESHVNVPERSLQGDYEHLCQQVDPLASSETMA